ncbi:ABC-type glycerol-3-phosphate transport system permease component [Devosia sp. UYZn731]|uniref:carbohydrate ABC transporter permease n=1 Tax=Devosia sp. UYZn731 TaxID=3156345 RepID=UPI003390A1B8
MQLSRPWTVVGHIVLLLICISILMPMVIVLSTAFKPMNEVYAVALVPQHPTLDNFGRLFQNTAFGWYIWNTAGTTVLRVVGQLIIGVLAAYAFARFHFRGRDTLFTLVIGAMMIPQVLTMLPIYIMMAQLGWFDTWWALIIPNLATPIAVFLLRQHIMSFPSELMDAAEMDGAGHWTALWRVIVPNLGPALAALTIIIFIESWNEYFWPLLVTESPKSRTIQIGLREFLQEGMSDYGALMAGIIVASIPAVAVFLFFQRRVMDTFVSSGLKG